jgi:hypothetical protein
MLVISLILIYLQKGLRILAYIKLWLIITKNIHLFTADKRRVIIGKVSVFFNKHIQKK